MGFFFESLTLFHKPYSFITSSLFNYSSTYSLSSFFQYPFFSFFSNTLHSTLSPYGIHVLFYFLRRNYIISFTHFLDMLTCFDSCTIFTILLSQTAFPQVQFELPFPMSNHHFSQLKHLSIWCLQLVLHLLSLIAIFLAPYSQSPTSSFSLFTHSIRPSSISICYALIFSTTLCSSWTCSLSQATWLSMSIIYHPF